MRPQTAYIIHLWQSLRSHGLTPYLIAKGSFACACSANVHGTNYPFLETI